MQHHSLLQALMEKVEAVRLLLSLSQPSIDINKNPLDIQHWRRLAPRWKTWEESRHEWAEPTIQVLSSYGIKTIGSLWLAKISGQLNSIPEMEVEMVNKMSRCLEFLADFIMSELLAPEEYGKEEISEADLEDRIRAMSK